ncbi:serine-rich adhesin for platelets isoform X1 [Diorhabda carinulata]|uniref:serine-rich adhesin for platelets isoform X1 n=1 Tax=Diorhabda carinulata TaxID=1163345 RepID=UPI0025A2C196|nr:serine-rich adhesin for platelets isoform X1 [Diorhabda carinulata]
MPFVQRFVEPKFLSRAQLFDDDGHPKIGDFELEAVANNTLCNALRQLASLLLAANDIFDDLGQQLEDIKKRSENLKVRIKEMEGTVEKFDPKEVTVPESDIASFAVFKNHFTAKQPLVTNLFVPDTRPTALRTLYETATKTPVHLMRQLDRWRRDGFRSSRFFVCTPVLGAKRRKIRTKVDIDIETSMPAAIEELRRWTSNEALGDVTVTPDCASRITSTTFTDGKTTDGTIASDDEGIDHKLPSPEEQLQVVALKFPAEIVAVDITGKNFDRMSLQRRSLNQLGQLPVKAADGATDETNIKRRSRTRRTRSRRRNTLAGTDQKEIRDALTAGEEPSSPTISHETECSTSGAVLRSKSSDILRTSKKESPEPKKSHFNTLKQWGKSRYDKFMNKSSEGKCENKTRDSKESIDDINVYETVTTKRKRDIEKERRTHERNSSISSSEKSSINVPISNPLSSVMNIAVKLRDSSAQRRLKRLGNREEPHSSSGNWSASSESGRASIGSEITSTTHPKSTASTTTSSNSLNQQQQPGSVNSRRRFNVNTSTSGSVTSEGTLTPDIIHDLHEDGETSSVYSCDTEGYYTSFHMDSGLKTLKEEDTPPTPLHSTSAFSNSDSNNTVLSAENEYELFGKGSTSTTTSSAGTVCTTLRAADSNKSLVIGPAVPERKSSLSKLSNKSNESTLERDFSDKTGTVKRSPAANIKPVVVAIIHKQNDGDVSPDSGHNTSSSPIESISSPNGVRSGSDFEFSESSDMEGPERIERIRVKTTINSSRIPSMCVITPPHSDDESENSSNSSHKNYENQLIENNAVNRKNNDVENKSESSNIQHIISTSVNGTNKLSLVSVNPQSGYATIERLDQPDGAIVTTETKSSTMRAPSPSGGTVTVKEEIKTSPPQPIIKASLLPLNNMLGRLKSNIVNFAHKRDRSKSPNANKDPSLNKLEDNLFDAGEYVTIADVRNNNEKSVVITENQHTNYIQDIVNKNLTTVLSGKIRDAEYVSLNELPCNENNNITTTTSVDSLERKRLGARVLLDAEGKVVYSSDSLRRKGAHTTFEPGKNVKPTNSPSPSPLPVHRTIKSVRPIANSQNQMIATIPTVEFNRPLSPQTQKIVIKANTGTAEIVRKLPSTIVTPATSPTSPKTQTKGAYVNMQDTGTNPTHEKERVQSPTKQFPKLPVACSENVQTSPQNMYRYGEQLLDMDANRYISNQYYLPRGSSMYSTLPSKKTQFFTNETKTERSVTPDITRGLERSINFDQRNIYKTEHTMLNQRLGIPVQMPDINRLNLHFMPSYTPQKKDPRVSFQYQSGDDPESLKISPIDPRHSGSFQSSTPSSKGDLRAATNLENKLLSPKKSTMSNEELYAVIHKSKKKMNIETEESPRASPLTVKETSKKTIKSPETGYIGDKSKSRLSWSPSKGEYIDFNEDIDKLSPPNDSRSRQSWACSDRKPKTKQTSTLDFKRLLLQKSSTNSPKKLSAVEQLKLSKQRDKPAPSKPQPEMSILDLSASPRSLVNRKFSNNAPGSPSREQKSLTKVLSPRSQWRFNSPRSDVLSSPILEDCREDESPNSSSDRKGSPKNRNSNSSNESSPKGMPKLSAEPHPYTSATQRLYAQRAQYFSPITSRNIQLNNQEKEKKSSPPTLETAF